MPLEEISLNLASVAQDVLKYIEESRSSMVVEDRGRRYKQIGGQFLRIDNLDKHLTISLREDELDELYSIKSSYHILSGLGNIVKEFKHLCLAIILVSRELEVNKWYDEISKTCTVSARNYDTESTDEEALMYISGISEEEKDKYIEVGVHLLTYTIIEFFQSDHFTSRNTLESPLMHRILKQLYYDDEHTFQRLIKSNEALQAITALGHWVSIRYVLKANGMYGVNIPNIDEYNKQLETLKPIPKAPEWLNSSLFQRYPAGASKFLLTKDCLYCIAESPIYGRYLSVPNEFNIHQFFKICDDIEFNPLRYHIRSSPFSLSIDTPLDVNKIYPQLNSLMAACAAIIHGANGDLGSTLVQAKKFPPLRQLRNHKLYQESFRLYKNKDKEKFMNNLSKEMERLNNSFEIVVAKYAA